MKEPSDHTIKSPPSADRTSYVNSADDVRWEDPPADGRKLYEQALPFAKLKAEPYRWARVLIDFPGRSAHNVAGRIRKGDYPSILPGEYEAVARALTDSKPPKYGLWMRYVGHTIDGDVSE